jgi:hypothetical protein
MADRKLSFNVDISVSDVLSEVTAQEAYKHFGAEELVGFMDLSERLAGYTLEDLFDEVFDIDDFTRVLAKHGYNVIEEQ